MSTSSSPTSKKEPPLKENGHETTSSNDPALAFSLTPTLSPSSFPKGILLSQDHTPSSPLNSNELANEITKANLTDPLQESHSSKQIEPSQEPISLHSDSLDTPYSLNITSPLSHSTDEHDSSLGTAHTLDFDEHLHLSSFNVDTDSLNQSTYSPFTHLSSLDSADSETISGPTLIPSTLRLQTGQYFGQDKQYEILKEIGMGGMGAVYSAYNHTLKRQVALKVIFDQSKNAKKLLIREAQSIAQLEHPHIVNVYHIGEHKDSIFIEMQLIEGQSLRSLLDQEKISTERGLKFLNEIAQALHHAHQKGVIHRDIKVENVLVSQEDRCTLVDFGLAQNTEDALSSLNRKVSGTPAYMAPEVWTGETPDFSTDLYAFGVMAYLLFTQDFPFKGKNWRELFESHQSTDRDGLKENLHESSLPLDLQELVLRCLHPHKEMRLSSSQTLLDELDRIYHHIRFNEETQEDQDPHQTRIQRWKTWRISKSLQKQVLALFLFCFLNTYTQMWHSLDLVLLDFLQSIQPTHSQFPVGLVKIDELSPEEHKLYLNRRELSILGERLLQQGTKGLGIDLVEYHVTQPLYDEAWTELAQSPEIIHSVMPSFENRNQIKTIKPFNRLKTFIHQVSQSTSLNTQITKDREDSPHSLPISPLISDSDLAQKLIHEPELIFPYPQLLEESQHLGHIVIHFDDDGVSRNLPLFIRHHHQLYPSLSLVLVCQSLGIPLQSVRYQEGVVILNPPDQDPIRIPVDDEGKLLIRIRGEPQDRSSWSFLDLRLLNRDDLKKAIPQTTLLLGDTSPFGGDFGALGPWRHTPMVYTHLLAAENILNRDFISFSRLGPSLLFSFLIALLCFLLLLRISTSLSLLIMIGMNCLTYGFAFMVLIGFNQVLPVGTALVLVNLSGLWSAAYKGFQDRKERLNLNQKLGEILPKHFVKRLINEKDYQEREALQSQRFESVLIALRFFELDQMSETISPKLFAQTLNKVSRLIRKTAISQGGMVYQANRNCVLITFHPSRLKENPFLPYICAVKLQKLLELESWYWKEIAQNPQFGMALHHSPFMMGPVSLNQDVLMSLCGVGVDLVEHLSLYSQNSLLLSEAALHYLQEHLAYSRTFSSLITLDLEGPSCHIGTQIYKTAYLKAQGVNSNQLSTPVQK